MGSLSIEVPLRETLPIELPLRKKVFFRMTIVRKFTLRAIASSPHLIDQLRGEKYSIEEEESVDAFL